MFSFAVSHSQHRVQTNGHAHYVTHIVSDVGRFARLRVKRRPCPNSGVGVFRDSPQGRQCQL